jgi:hypothetical protein
LHCRLPASKILDSFRDRNFDFLLEFLGNDDEGNVNCGNGMLTVGGAEVAVAMGRSKGGLRRVGASTASSY